MRFAIDLVYILAAVVISPVIIYRMIRYQRYRRGWGDRFGSIKRRDLSRPCVWIHAVSVGEVNATRTIIAALEEKYPAVEIVISTTTDTGYARAKSLYGSDKMVFYFPLDLSCVVSRAFRNIRPSLCVLMELEVWPNFVRRAAKKGVPVCVVNGRISEKSFAVYKRIKPIAGRIFGNVTLILAQTEEYARRFVEIGCRAERVKVTGSLKYDTAQTAGEVEGAAQLAQALKIGDQKLLVAGGTGNEEEKIILDAFAELKAEGAFPQLHLAVVPRKPERFDLVAEVIREKGFELIRYSRIKAGAEQAEADSQKVILGDTMGDLRKFYAVGYINFVGRSLVPMGGSDMMEAAALGRCTVFGPHAFNFSQTVDELLKNAGAVLVHDQAELVRTVRRLLNEPEYTAEIARNGRRTIKDNQGATARTIDHLIPIVINKNAYLN